MNFRAIFYINGFLLLILSAAMLFPALVDIQSGSNDWKVFAGAQIITAFCGFLLISMNYQKKFSLTLKETFLMTTFSWIFMAIFAALPFVMAEINLSYTDAFFEAMSGITTTGSTVIVGLEDLPQGILLWRMMLHWLGGIGFLIIALAILPLLQISGMQLFKTQSFEIEKVMPSASQLAVAILAVYAGLTMFFTFLLYAAGMGFFDALCHAMSGVSTGGFSTKDSSVGHFQNPLVDTILCVAMLSGAMPFVLYLRALRGEVRALTRDSQVITFLSIVAILSLLTAGYVFYTGQMGLADALRNSFFMISALITTTGLINNDYMTLGPFVIGVAFLVSFMGSCSGSTAGGVKIFRLQILWAMFHQQLRRLIMPHGVFQIKYNGKAVDPTVQAAVAGFFFVYIAIWLVFGLLLQLTGLDFLTAYSASISALSNVGAGIGPVIGPTGTYEPLSDGATWILTAAMLMGRLEFMTLFVLFMPDFWRR